MHFQFACSPEPMARPSIGGLVCGLRHAKSESCLKLLGRESIDVSNISQHPPSCMFPFCWTLLHPFEFWLTGGRAWVLPELKEAPSLTLRKKATKRHQCSQAFGRADPKS